MMWAHRHPAAIISPVEIFLNKRAGVPVREQITAQIEIQILSGDFKAGERLPSVRALARRLKVHPNTVSAAYRLLQEHDRLEMRRGAGVFVRSPGPRELQEARDLDEMIRLGLHVALERYSGDEVRAAVVRWLAGAPPARMLAIDPSREMGELLARELSDALGIPAAACSLGELREHRERLSGTLGVTLLFHLEKTQALVPGASIEGVALKIPTESRKAILDLRAGEMVLIVSHSPDVLQLTSVFVRSLRGDELVVEARLDRANREWRLLLSASDLVLADAIAFPEVSRACGRRVQEVRFLARTTIQRLRTALSVVVPKPQASSGRS